MYENELIDENKCMYEKKCTHEEKSMDKVKHGILNAEITFLRI